MAYVGHTWELTGGACVGGQSIPIRLGETTVFGLGEKITYSNQGGGQS